MCNRKGKSTNNNRPDIQILPRNLFFLIFISAMCYSAVARSAWHLLNAHTGSQTKFLRMNFFSRVPCCLKVFYFPRSRKSDIARLCLLFAKKKIHLSSPASKMLCKHLEDRQTKEKKKSHNLFSLLPARCSVDCNLKNGHCHKPNECM
jgi:hypothetical protein